MKSVGPAALVFFLFCCSALAADNRPRRVRFREPHQTRYVLENTAGEWTTAQEESSKARVEIGSRIVLQTEPGKDVATLIANRGVTIARTINPNLFVLQAQNSRSAIDVAEALALEPGVVASHPVMRRPFRHHNPYAPLPNDPYFPLLWQLENRGADGNLAGPDLNTRAAWPVTAGAGVLVAVGDDGFQLDHPELINAANGGPHYNFFEGISDGGPYGSGAVHATAVAGLIAAEKNNRRGVSGVAPQAKLASWVIWGTNASGSEDFVTDEQLMDMFQYSSNRVAVQNHSWGSGSLAESGMTPLPDVAISNAVIHGRGGKGVVLVRSGGNGRLDSMNANDDGFVSDPRTIAVAAVRQDGRACYFSSPGACLLVSAPSGDPSSDPDPIGRDVLTTDRTGSAGYVGGTGDSADYTGFAGTSASSPEVAGVAALVLSANTNLTYRDVQQIILQSARHFDLADPDIHTNGAGFRFSHNQGFGVPDAGFAVQLARHWGNRPPAIQVTMETNVVQGIPDDALRVICAGAGLSASLTNIRCLPSLGVHPDDPTATLPLVYVGQANAELAVDLHGKGALIQRGNSFFRDKIARAARAGAAFAIIFNNTGTSDLLTMALTDYAPIPTVFIGKTDGDALSNFVTNNAQTTARLQLTSAVYRFKMTNTLACEHVGVRLDTTHSSRSDVRVTLVSPMGTRSVLQAINQDLSSGPVDWTYWSTQHFYESSFGEWRVEVSDERNTTTGLGLPAIGLVTYVQLLVRGVPITDTDHDGLDDNWEMQQFGDLTANPKDDLDQDGFNNVREQMLGTDPVVPNAGLKLDIATLKPGYYRLSWPAAENFTYTLLSNSNLPHVATSVTNLPGRFPVREFVVGPGMTNQFFRVRQN